MNTRYIMFLFYDIPNSNKNQRKQYTRFRKYVLSVGFIMLQESVYVRTINTKNKYLTLRRDIKLTVPETSDVRTLLITENSYEQMDLINGELTFKEKIVSKKVRVLEL